MHKSSSLAYLRITKAEHYRLKAGKGLNFKQIYLSYFAFIFKISTEVLL